MPDRPDRKRSPRSIDMGEKPSTHEQSDWLQLQLEELKELASASESSGQEPIKNDEKKSKTTKNLPTRRIWNKNEQQKKTSIYDKATRLYQHNKATSKSKKAKIIT